VCGVGSCEGFVAAVVSEQMGTGICKAIQKRAQHQLIAREKHLILILILF